MKTRASLLPAVLVAVAALEGHQPLRLEVADGRGRIVGVVAVHPGEACDLSFRHSVERVPWRQHYVVRAGGLDQTGSSFPSYGAGMPSTPEEGRYSRQGGWLRYEARVRLGPVTWLNSREAGVTLRCGDRMLALSDLVDDMATFSVSVR